ncbi:MAG: RluA family pseudouridine synthase [Candidatus Margulisiibacteriota bacterium]
MLREFEYIIAGEEKGERIDHYLAGKKEIGRTRSQIHKLIEDGYVEVNKEVPKPSCKIKLDDRIVIKIPPPKKLEGKPENIPLEIVYEDKDLIVVNKPRGMVVHPAAGNYSGTLVNALLFHCKDLSGIGGVLRPGIVHRLDKDTSGLLVIAKNDLAHQALARQFKAKQIFKQYQALVHGVVQQEKGVIEAKIGRDPKHRKKMAIIRATETRVKGREAVTHYRVLERFKNYTLVELDLKTGRTHQIRVHLTFFGHSIVGDPTYGHRKEEFKVLGQLLHAARLGFVHPQTKKYVEFRREMPEDMEEVVRKLRKK